MAVRVALATGIAEQWLLANNLTAPPVNAYWRPYSRSDFENAQAAKRVDFKPEDTWFANEHAYCRIVETSSAAAKKDRTTYMLAMYKLSAFLDEWQHEFGVD